MKWNTAEPDGSTSTGTWQQVNPDRWAWTALMRNALGKTVLEVEAVKVRVASKAAPTAVPKNPADVLPFLLGTWKMEGVIIEPALPGGLEARPDKS